MKIQSGAIITVPFTGLPVASNVVPTPNEITISKLYLEFGLFQQFSKLDLVRHGVKTLNVELHPKPRSSRMEVQTVKSEKKLL